LKFFVVVVPAVAFTTTVDETREPEKYADPEDHTG
jgi:hypothetical protein